MAAYVNEWNLNYSNNFRMECGAFYFDNLGFIEYKK